MPNRKPYPSDVSDKEWSFVALIWRAFEKMRPNETNELREVLTGLRWVVLVLATMDDSIRQYPVAVL